MHDILTVTFNPALDIATSVGHVTAGVKLRCATPTFDPGGGGINVARAIRKLGGNARAFVALGGDTGDHVHLLLKEAGIPLVVHPAPGHTRQSLAVMDEGLGDQYRFMLPGPEWSAAEIEKAVQVIKETATPGGYVVLSGSGPAGVGPELFTSLCEALTNDGRRIIIDTSGKPLAYISAGHASRPYVLRMDQGEAEGLAARALRSKVETAAFARELHDRGAAEIVIIARGAEGSVLTTSDASYFVAAASVEVKSRVGAGDSFVGGFTYGLAVNRPLLEALQMGSAAASAAVMTEGTELCRKEDADRLFPLSHVSQI